MNLEEFEKLIEFLYEFSDTGSIEGEAKYQRARLIEVCKDIAVSYWNDKDEYVRVVSYYDY
jgi:hypothetical protein